VVERGVPVGLASPVLVVGGRRGEAGVVVGEPGLEPGPELGFLGRVEIVHQRAPAATPRRSRSSWRSCSPSSPNHCDDRSARRTWRWTMHSHVLPIPPCTWIAVSPTVRAARVQYALATRPAARASC